MKRKIIYIAECNCRLYKSELVNIIYKQKSGKASRIYGCPEHRKKIIQRMSMCTWCGDILYDSPTGRMRLRCVPCQKKYKREKNRKANLAFKKKKAKAPKKTIVKINKLNKFNCSRFDDLCGFCIMTQGVKCKMFLKPAMETTGL